MTLQSTNGAAPVARPRPRPLVKRIMAQPAGAILLVFGALQVVCVLAGLIWPDDFRYLAPQNLTILMRAIPVLGCLALGVGILMIAGEFDLSIGSVYAFTAILTATMVEAGLSGFLAAPLGIAAGAAIGLSNGAITLRFGLPSFIVMVDDSSSQARDTDPRA